VVAADGALLLLSDCLEFRFELVLLCPNVSACHEQMITCQHYTYKVTIVIIYNVTSALLTQVLTTVYLAHMAKKSEEPRGTSSVSVRLPDDLIAWIDEQAQQERRSRGSFIKNALEDLKKARDGKK
jgi:hypothetical protein